MIANRKEYLHPQYLVETDWLEENLDTEDLRIFDCSVNVEPNPNPHSVSGQHRPFVFTSGRNNYQLAHIPGAGFIDVPGELSDLSADLPLMMPSEKQFVEAMSQYGICDDTRVVLYGATEPNWPARVWWMLHSFGFTNVSILNGGWKKWCSENRPASSEVCAYAPEQFISRTVIDKFVNKDDVLAAIGNSSVRIINALPSPLHLGTSDIYFGRKGRIADSVNLPFGDLHDPETGCYLPAETLDKKFNAISVGSAERVVTYCGGGVASSNTAFALNLLGYDNVTVYDGSMLEWGNDETLPMETG